MANEQNLIPLSQRTKDKQREIQVKGGKASVKKRRKIKAAKEYMKQLISLPLDATQHKFGEYMEQAGIEEIDQNQLSLLLMSVLKKAQKGDIKSAELVLSLIGEMPASKQEITGADGTPLMPTGQVVILELPDNGRDKT